MSIATIRLRDGSISVNRGNRFIDRTGNVYGNLTVLGLDVCVDGNVRWKCLCSCGKEKSILARALNRGQISCGCASRDNLAGKRFGRLLVLSFHGNRAIGKQGRTISTWNCVCDCGTERVVSGNSLSTGNTQSCGCFAKEAHLESHFVHGATIGEKSREYNIWSNMKNRCSNPKSNRFHIYGGRGIKVCERWLDSFSNFLADMGNCPKGCSIDRINTDGNYEPGNCRWATAKEQANNMRVNRFLEFKGERMTVSQWSDKTGISRSAIFCRIDRLGWSVERALTTQT